MTPTASMIAIEISAPGGPEVLRTCTRPVPTPAPNQVLVRVAAAGINRHDCGQRRRGAPPEGATDIPGLEIAGEVVAIGSAVTRHKPGAGVCALVNGGGYAEYCVAEQELALPIPGGLSAQAAVALPEALFTLWHNLFELCGLEPGEWLLVHGGASGVGTIAIQLARAFGMPVIATAGSDEKCALAARLGAAHTVNYRSADFVSAAKRATGGRGVDVILDMAGGVYGERNLEALAPDGRITHLTNFNAPRYEIDLASIMKKRARVTGSMLRPLPPARKAAIALALERRVWPLVGSAIRPVIDSEFALADARAAHERIEGGANLGKILLIP